MRILHVIPQFGVGGTERIVADLMRSQRITDEPKLCVLGSPNEHAPGFGAKVDRFLGFSGSLRDLQGITRCHDALHEMIRDIRPNVIHAHLWPAALFAVPAAADMDIRCVVHVHDTPPWLASGRMRDLFLRAIHRRMLKGQLVRMLAVSNAVKYYTVRNLPCPAKAIGVVHNGIDANHFRKMHDHSQNGKVPIIGSVGRLEPEKGFIHLIRAAGVLRERKFHFRLAIAGMGSQRTVLETLISELGLNEIVRLVGMTRDVQSFYENLDIFVLPSVAAEGLPLTILEAMAMELPVIATSIAGAPEVIGNDGTHGQLIPPADPAALAHAIQEMIQNREMRAVVGRRARTRVESCFAIEQMAGRIQNHYRELM